MPTQKTEKPSLLAALGETLGSNSKLDPGSLDSALLWIVVVALLRKSAAIHLGMNKAGSSIIITLYDGDFPHKEFCDSIERAHHVLAAVARTYGGKNIPPAWEELIQQYYP